MDAMRAIAPTMGDQSVVSPSLSGVRHVDFLMEFRSRVLTALNLLPLMNRRHCTNLDVGFWHL
jgi:hypothetical protein